MMNYSNIEFAGGSLGINFAGNLNDTKIKGEINTPQVLADNGYDIFNRKEQARITDSRPKTKIMLTRWVQLNYLYFNIIDWSFKNKFINELHQS